jgi:hypothetical protein
MLWPGKILTTPCISNLNIAHSSSADVALYNNNTMQLQPE